MTGRAGRRNSIYPKGLVGTHKQADLPRVIEAVNMPLAQLSTPAAGLFPEFQHLELLAGQVMQTTTHLAPCLPKASCTPKFAALKASCFPSAFGALGWTGDASKQSIQHSIMHIKIHSTEDILSPVDTKDDVSCLFPSTQICKLSRLHGS